MKFTHHCRIPSANDASYMQDEIHHFHRYMSTHARALAIHKSFILHTSLFDGVSRRQKADFNDGLSFLLGDVFLAAVFLSSLGQKISENLLESWVLFWKSDDKLLLPSVVRAPWRIQHHHRQEIHGERKKYPNLILHFQPPHASLLPPPRPHTLLQLLQNLSSTEDCVQHEELVVEEHIFIISLWETRLGSFMYVWDLWELFLRVKTERTTWRKRKF